MTSEEFAYKPHSTITYERKRFHVIQSLREYRLRAFARSYFFLSPWKFFLSARYFLLSAQIFFVTKFVTRITKFVTCVRKFVTAVTKFVTNFFYADSKKYQGGREKYQEERKILLCEKMAFDVYRWLCLRVQMIVITWPWSFACYLPGRQYGA